MPHPTSWSYRVSLVGTLAALLAPALIHGADAAGGDELSKLKASLAELKERVDDLTANADGKPADDSGTLFTLKGFGNIDYVASSTKAENGDRSTVDQYAVGALDLFMNARLGERVSFLAETAIEADDNATGIDVERILVKYYIDDWLNIQAGRFHTTLGYWNENYHHGEWLNTAIGRPVALNFEDGGGILPVHVVGLVFKGTRTFGALGLDYTLETGNGRGPTSDPPQITNDSNTAKAVNLNLAVRPLAIPGLKFGASAYFDKISPYVNTGPGDDNPSHEQMRERILNAYVVYRNGPWEALTEIFQLHHQITSGPEDGKRVIDFAYYGQFGYRYHEWTPYVRYDVIQLSDEETYFPTAIDNRRTTSIGLRWDVAPWNAIKVQYDRIHHLSTPAAGLGGSVEHALEVQTAFAF
jgi:hypothetical protein